MVKKARIAATVALIVIVVVLFWGALNTGRQDGEDDGGDGEDAGPRVPFVTWVGVFLAFVAGFGLRDAVGRWFQRRPRPAPPSQGRKAA